MCGCETTCRPVEALWEWAPRTECWGALTGGVRRTAMETFCRCSPAPTVQTPQQSVRGACVRGYRCGTIVDWEIRPGPMSKSWTELNLDCIGPNVDSLELILNCQRSSFQPILRWLGPGDVYSIYTFGPFYFQFASFSVQLLFTRHLRVFWFKNLKYDSMAPNSSCTVQWLDIGSVGALWPHLKRDAIAL